MGRSDDGPESRGVFLTKPSVHTQPVAAAGAWRQRSPAGQHSAPAHSQASARWHVIPSAFLVLLSLLHSLMRETTAWQDEAEPQSKAIPLPLYLLFLAELHPGLVLPTSKMELTLCPLQKPGVGAINEIVDVEYAESPTFIILFSL